MCGWKKKAGGYTAKAVYRPDHGSSSTVEFDWTCFIQINPVKVPTQCAFPTTSSIIIVYIILHKDRVNTDHVFTEVKLIIDFNAIAHSRHYNYSEFYL